MAGVVRDSLNVNVRWLELGLLSGERRSRLLGTLQSFEEGLIVSAISIEGWRRYLEREGGSRRERE